MCSRDTFSCQVLIQGLIRAPYEILVRHGVIYMLAISMCLSFAHSYLHPNNAATENMMLRVACGMSLEDPNILSSNQYPS